jgi:subtilisin family serine protease
MRAFARCSALAAIALTAIVLSASGQSARAAVPALADSSASQFDSQHDFVVVTFSNNPYRPASHAGTTGRRYSGDSYGIGQNAHDQAQRVATVYALRQVASWPIKELSVHCVVYEIMDSRSVSEVLSALAKDPRVTLAEPLQQFHSLTSEPAAAAYNDPLFGLQTSLTSLGIPAAHQHSQGAGVRIGLIDTGVDTKHPDLKDRIARVKSFVDVGAAGPAAYRHGTAMAGLIAAVANNNVGIVGIAPLARIEVFEACWQLRPNADEAACNTFTLAQALAAAIEAHLPLINLSISGPADALLSAIVNSGIRRGVIFVGSTAAEADSFPTNIDGVIGVSNSDHGQGDRAKGSSTLAAPGTHVLTLRPDGQYDFESGTSVAAAEVTGMIALLLGEDGHQSSGSIVSLLRQTAMPGPEHPTIDIAAALTQMEAGRAASRLARATH